MTTWCEFWYLTVAIKNVKQVPDPGFIMNRQESGR